MNLNQTIIDNTKTLKIRGSISESDVCRLRKALTESDGFRGIRLDLSETENISPEFIRLITEIKGGHRLKSIRLVNPNEFIVDILKGGSHENNG